MDPINNFILQLLLFLSKHILTTRSQGNCPMHCSECLPKYISCTNGGLTSIPMQFLPETEKITLMGQLQFNGILSSANFSDLAPPRYKIHTLVIRSSSIQELSSYTFSKLTALKFLDLSENQRLTIMSSAFSSLFLKHLKLDDIGKLILSQGSFNGLSIESLSMKNSRLQSLNFDIFSPISNTLKHLFIENNQIRTLDKKFEPLFYRLETVNLKDNPFLCYCPLLWLNKALKTKMLTSKYQTRISDSSSETNNFPKCVAPSYLRNRQLQSIMESEFNCQIPQIAQIEIDLVSLFSGMMSCRIKPEEKGHKIPTKIFWQKKNSENGIEYKRLSEKPLTDVERLLSETNGIEDLSSTIRFSSERHKNPGKYQCIAENSAGRSLLAVHISWPHLNGSFELQHQNSLTTVYPKKTSSNLYHWNTVHQRSYFFTKQYTLLEMTAAIGGTFILTVLIFLIFYKLYFRKPNGYKSGKPSLKYSIATEPLGTNKRSLMTFHSSRGGYTVYETSMHYSDNSQTYDSIPHNAVFAHQQQPLFSTISNSPSAHFIDYKTHKSLYPSPPSN